MKQFVPVVLCLALATGCASYPDAVSVPEGTPLVEFSQAQSLSAMNDKTSVRHLARWSGLVASVQNLPDRTRLEIVAFPAADNGRPRVQAKAQGRFVAYVPGFIDPLVYQKGSAVTVLGELSTTERGKIDQFEYDFSVLQQAKVHLWPVQVPEQRVEIVDPWLRYDPYWRQGPTIIIQQPQPMPEGPASGEQ